MFSDTNTGAHQIALSLMSAWGANAEALIPSPSSQRCPRLSKFLIKLDEVVFDGRVFVLHEPIEVALYEEDGVWYCEKPEFSILAFGNTPVEAAHSFCEDFAVLWEEIAQAPDDSLAPEAQKVKQALLSTVNSVR